MGRCKHGFYIHDSWQECPDCCAEEDAYRASVAAQETAEEARKQTKLLEEMARARESAAEEEAERLRRLREELEEERELEVAERTSSSKRLESQKLALYAEDRHRMRDTLGALRLIDQAIELDSSFLSFYQQRAKYLTALGKIDNALADITFLVKTDLEYFQSFEKNEHDDNLGDFQSIRSEIKKLLTVLRDNVRTTAHNAIEQTEEQVSKMRSHFEQGSVPNFIRLIEDEFQELIRMDKTDSYPLHLQVPTVSKRVTQKASEAIQTKIKLEETVKLAIASLQGRLPPKGTYRWEADVAIDQAGKFLANASIALGKNSYDSLNLASSIVQQAEEYIRIAEKIKKEDDDAKLKWEAEEKERRKRAEEERQRIQRQKDQEEWERKRQLEKAEYERKKLQERRNEASKSYALGGAWTLGIIGALAGCVSCVEKGDFNLFGGAILGALAGALLGAIAGQLKS